MTNDLLSACFPVINRPEYPKQPEWLQASLAWRMAGDDLVQQEDDGKLVGFVFREREKTTSKKVKMVETRPNPAGSLWEALCRAGVVDVPGLSAQHVCETLLDAMEGVNPAKAKAFGAVPLVPACAFLEDAVGVHAKTNPPDFGLIVEQAYRAGNREIVAENEASCLYWKALAHVLSDPMMASLNSALSEHLALLGVAPLPTQPVPGDRPDIMRPAWLATARSPFAWFQDAWRAFCKEGWRRTLPPRRWNDWASCLLRTGIGMGFLWEAALFREVGRAVHSGDDSALRAVYEGGGGLMGWLPADAPLSVRDVNRLLRRLVADGQAVRSTLAGHLRDQDHGSLKQELKRWGTQGPPAFAKWVRAQGWKDEVVASLGRAPSSASNNTIETVQYLLQCRDEGGREADFYGLLVRRSRSFLCVQPGAEWIVVVASLAAGQPGASVNLGQVRDACRRIGLDVSRATLVAELERAGLTKSSHDADDAIVVRAAF